MKLAYWLKQQWNALPHNYLPGTTLARLAHDLSGLSPQPITATCWQFSQLGARWHFEVSEQVQRQFLMHIVSSRFLMSVSHSVAGNAHISLTHRGLWRRTGLNWKIQRGDNQYLQALLARLHADEPLFKALMALDFQRFELIQDRNGWRVEAQTYGASEVVMRFPAMRRYIRLEFDQAQHLLNALARLQGILRIS